MLVPRTTRGSTASTRSKSQISIAGDILPTATKLPKRHEKVEEEEKEKKGKIIEYILKLVAIQITYPLPQAVQGHSLTTPVPVGKH